CTDARDDLLCDAGYYLLPNNAVFRRLRERLLSADIICAGPAHSEFLPSTVRLMARSLRESKMLTIYRGRHMFISHALAGGRTLAEVHDAAGHANVSITSAYLHAAVDDDTSVGNLFRLV